VETARANGVKPRAHLANLFEKLPAAPPQRCVPSYHSIGSRTTWSCRVNPADRRTLTPSQDSRRQAR
jgi:hypothetical protein